MKKYLKTPEEVISALKAGKTVYSDCGKYKMIDGFIVYEGGGICNINANLTLLESPFVKEAEPLKIEVGKFYKTRDGKKARCFLIQANVPKFCVDNYGIFTTDMNGKVFKHYEEANDIIGPWEEE